MPTPSLLPLPDELELTAMSKTLEGLLVWVTSTRPSSVCPLCATPSQAVHSSYRRIPLDLPCTGQTIRLPLSVRKFFCRVPHCPRKIFTERIPELLAPSSRMTDRLRMVVQAIGFAFNGQGGARLGAHLGIQVSRPTLLKSLYLVPAPGVGQVSAVGVDDFAWKRGRGYGTIILDLHTHKILDLLPDREAESVQKGLSAHPEIEIVSRDRGGAYADGAAQGAPQAIQVADRWHLAKNLGDGVETSLVRRQLKVAPLPLGEPEPSWPVAQEKPIETKQAELDLKMQVGRERKQEQHEQIRGLYQHGTSIHGIGRHLEIARKTVRTHLRMGDELGGAERPKKRSILDPYYEYIVQRWREGCTTGQQILREIRALGFRGSATTARSITTRLRKDLAGMAHPPKHPSEGKCSYSPRELRWLLAKRSTDLKPEEQEDLARLLEASEEARTVHHLIQSFLLMLGERRADQLNGWMKEARESGIKELRSFVAGLERDYDAVRAGLSSLESKGSSEEPSTSSKLPRGSGMAGLASPCCGKTPSSHMRGSHFRWVSPKSYMSQVYIGTNTRNINYFTPLCNGEHDTSSVGKPRVSQVPYLVQKRKQIK